MKTLTLAAAIVAASLPTLVRANDITVTITGSVLDGGSGNPSYFGTTDYSGLSYTAVMTFNLASGFGNPVTGVIGGNSPYPSNPLISAVLTMNNHSYDFTETGYNVLSAQGYEFVALTEAGNSEFVLEFSIYDYANSSLPVSLAPTSFNVSGTDRCNPCLFYIRDPSLNILASADLGGVDTITLTDPAVISPVPGPIVGAGLPGLLAGFSMLGVYWQRRKKLAA